MNDAAMRAYARELAAARLAGTESAPPPRRLTLAEGYAIQALAAPLLGRRAGWKVGATSDGAMAFLGVAEPIRGGLFAERLFTGGDIVTPAPLEAEPEVMLTLGRDLPPGGDVRAAVARAALAVELVRPTRADAFAQGPSFIVADNAAGWGVLLGPDVPLDALDAPAELRAALWTEDGARTAGAADAVLGDPLRALAWLAGAVGGLRAGDLVMTGAMARTVPVGHGDALVLDGGRWGQARAKILVMPPAALSN